MICHKLSNLISNLSPYADVPFTVNVHLVNINILMKWKNN